MSIPDLRLVFKQSGPGRFICVRRRLLPRTGNATGQDGTPDSGKTLVWDESWNANVYGNYRWKGISTTMGRYCEMLDSAWVRQQRAHYELQDTETVIDQAVSGTAPITVLDEF